MKFNNIYLWIENFIWNIKNLIRWIPQLWDSWYSENDPIAWDLVFRLEQMKHHFETEAILDDRHDVAKEIGEVIVAFEKWKEIQHGAVTRKDLKAEEDARYNAFYLLAKYINNWWE